MPAMTCARRHLWFSHELCYFHDVGSGPAYLPVGPLVEPLRGFAADPDLRRAEGLVEVAGTMEHFARRTPQPATDRELLSVHTDELVQRIECLSAQGHGDAGSYAPVNYHSAQAARLAAGAAIQAAEEVMAGHGDAYCLIRPPGHHAEPDSAMALCLYNNVALAARAAQRAGAARVMIVDWDVHYGNGISAAFADDPSVMYVSLHQSGLFPPGAGTLLETGHAGSPGTEINVPLPPGCGDGAYLAVMDRIVAPAARAFEPDVIMVGAGVDACGHDPMGRMMVTSMGFHALTERMVQLALTLCSGRILMVHEGGYSSWYQPLCVLAIANALAGLRPPYDPFLYLLGNLPGQSLQPHQERVISHLEQRHPALASPRQGEL